MSARKHKMSMLHNSSKIKQARKTCEGCGNTYSATHIKQHTDTYYKNGLWTCKSKLHLEYDDQDIDIVLSEPHQVTESDNEEDNLQEYMRDYEDLDADVLDLHGENTAPPPRKEHVITYSNGIMVVLNFVSPADCFHIT